MRCSGTEEECGRRNSGRLRRGELVRSRGVYVGFSAKMRIVNGKSADNENSH